MEYFLKPRIGFIGAGSIAEFHIIAAQAVGFELSAICARPKSIRAKALYEKYNINHNISEISQFADLNLDAISIIVSSESLLPIYNDLDQLQIPILIEKPVALSINDFSKDLDLDKQNVLVGYNRRFYSAIQRIKTSLSLEPDPHFNWCIPELSHAITSSSVERIKSIRENAVHTLDLIAYLFGPIENLVVKKQYDEIGFKSIAALLGFKFGSIGTLNLTFNLPMTQSAQIYLGSRVFQLDPVEFLKEYKEIEVKEPTQTFPMRTYSAIGPEWRIDPIDLRFKPGFYKQYQELMSMVLGNPRLIGASLRDAENASRFAEMLISGDNLEETTNR